MGDSRSPAHDAVPSRPVPPAPVAEQVIVGALVALASGIGDGVVIAVRSGERGGLVASLLAALHITAMTLPLGVLVGAAVGLVLAALRRTPWVEPLRRRMSSARALVTHDPDGFAAGVGGLAALGIFVLGIRVAAEHFATRYHDPGLAAWGMAGAAVALALAAGLAAAFGTAILRPLARRLGRVASPAGVLGLALLGVAGGSVAVAVRAPRLFEVYDPVAVAWLPSAAVAYLVLAVVVRARLRRRSPSPRRLVVGGVAVAVAAAAALVWTGATYGRSNAVRTALERPSITGLRLLRSYATLTDRDGDGHSFAFGGGDCDDSRSDVHPGARDIEGDGIDADCFAGDGSPEVASLSDGAYGEPPEGLSRPNFLLVTVDALRPDHLGCYGYDRPTSPEIDAFAKDAVQFDEVVAQSSRSIRSVPALRTGFYPSQIAYGPEYLWPTLEEENVTVEEVLQRQGYRTAVTMGTDYFERLGHFFQGYDEVQQIDRYRPPRPLPVTKALKQLRRLNAGSQPWFLWVHLFNVHEEYLWDDTPSRFGDDPVDAYDTEIVFADREVGRLLDGLNEAGAASDTVVAIASDHGEAFGEHGNRGHSFTIYEEELRVPLLVRVPGMKPRRVRQPVALFDLMPTILNLARVPVPKPMPARSLVPLMNGTDRFPEERLMFSEILPDGLYPYDQKAIRRGSDKLIWWVREGTFQLYDLEADPGEQNDLSDDQRERADELLGLLRAWVAETNRPELRQTDVLEENRLDKAPRNMTQRLDVDVGDTFTLLGFDLEETSYRPGERIKMDFFYKVRSETDRSLFLYVDVVGPNGYRVPHFHAHHYPLHGRYPTNRWEEGEILRDPVEMVIPKDIRTPVELRITFTALGPDRRPVPLHTEDGERSTVELTTVRVRPEGT